jgi:hypothetical protein
MSEYSTTTSNVERKHSVNGASTLNSLRNQNCKTNKVLQGTHLLQAIVQQMQREWLVGDRLIG